METSRNGRQHDISSDGITVWVNNAVGCIGRFGRNGIDIHHMPGSAESLKTECLFCTHAPTTRADWDLFVKKMLEFYKVNVPAKYMPRRFRG
jgi:hypothetical protein